MATAADERLVPGEQRVDLTDLPPHERVVSSDALHAWCTARPGAEPESLTLIGATFNVGLALRSTHVACPVEFWRSNFPTGVLLLDTRIAGLSFINCRIHDVFTDRLVVDTGLTFDSCEFSRGVYLSHTRIGGHLDWSQRFPRAPHEEHSEVADGSGAVQVRVSAFSVSVEKDIEFYSEVPVSGTLDFTDARVGGSMRLRATTDDEGSLEVQADRAVIEGDLALSEFRARSVSLSDARIGGEFRVHAATLSDPVFSLVAPGATVAKDVDLDDVELAGLLFLDGLRAQNVYLRRLRTVGDVRLHDVRIAEDLACRDATIGLNAESGALSAERAQIGRRLILQHTRLNGGVSFAGASCRTIDDDVSEAKERVAGSWGTAPNVNILGLTYEGFGENESSWRVEYRSAWLRLSRRFEWSSWHQLIEVYRQHGREEDARRAGIEMQRFRVGVGELARLQKLWRRLLGITVGYGYRPSLAAVWAVLLILVLALVVQLTPGSFVPSGEDVVGSAQPIGYAADVVLPVVDLGEAERFDPTGWARWVEWAFIVVGWALSLLFVAAFTRIVRD